MSEGLLFYMALVLVQTVRTEWRRWHALTAPLSDAERAELGRQLSGLHTPASDSASLSSSAK